MTISSLSNMRQVVLGYQLSGVSVCIINEAILFNISVCAYRLIKVPDVMSTLQRCLLILRQTVFITPYTSPHFKS